jgi:uncharacterized protein YdeI (YjbR/CyaY-like superfamily)
MVSNADKPVVSALTVAEWEAFLDGVPSDDGVRLRLRKKSSTVPGITYAEALDVALCFGWIDGQIQKDNDDYFLQTFTPRRAQSPWSKINRGHVERLISEAKMRPGGQAEIDRAKADGRWDRAYQMKDSQVPADFQAALDANPAASEAFTRSSKQNRFAILFRIGNVKLAATRERKINEYIAMLERGDRLR